MKFFDEMNEKYFAKLKREIAGRWAEAEAALNDAKLKNLAVRLLDSEDESGQVDGTLYISSDAYAALLDCLPEPIALELNRQVKATDGAFYLPEDHTLGEWRIELTKDIPDDSPKETE